MFPYLVDESSLEKAKKQPKVFKKITWNETDSEDAEWKKRGLAREALVAKVCQEDYSENPENFKHKKCFYLDHSDPYLRLGPIKTQVYSKEPLRLVFVDFMHPNEIDYLINKSKPNLSRLRHVDPSNYRGNKRDYNTGKRSTIIHKTVQYWFNDLDYPNLPNITSKVQDPSDDPNFSEVEFECSNCDVMKMVDEKVHKLSQRILQVTKMTPIGQFSSSQYQTTNYGLAGLCEIHADPAGYVMHDIKMSFDAKRHRISGDIIATVMGWLSDVKAGGATSFIQPGHEMLIQPEKGSVAFWMDLKADSTVDARTVHAGCPILMGQKWIFNKWLYSFDQWKNYPCLLEKGQTLKFADI